METVSFADIAIVACGTMSLELNSLREEGFLDTPKILYTEPGLHQVVQDLEHQLVKQITKAREQYAKVIVVYGGKFCYVNVDDPLRKMETIIAEQGDGITRIDATHCMDMLASETERDEIGNEMAGGEPVWWMTPGWIKYRQKVFKGWDKALANENFPRHSGGAIVLDGVSYMDTYMAETPEDFLEYVDWMGITLTPYTVTLDRFKGLLLEEARRLSS